MDDSTKRATDLLDACPLEVAELAKRKYKGHDIDYRHSNYCLGCRTKNRICLDDVKNQIWAAYVSCGYKLIIEHRMDSVTQTVQRIEEWKKQ